jgi:hypothetical protein
MAARILLYKHTFKRFKAHPRDVDLYVETHDKKLKKKTSIFILLLEKISIFKFDVFPPLPPKKIRGMDSLFSLPAGAHT